MTPAQLVALKMLAERPRFTAKFNEVNHIGGRVAACLARMGFARRCSAHEPRYEITAAGLTELERTDKP